MTAPPPTAIDIYAAMSRHTETCAECRSGDTLALCPWAEEQLDAVLAIITGTDRLIEHLDAEHEPDEDEPQACCLAAEREGTP